ncbi:FAD binding domain-containing protein [Hypomontagnella monticulosa]|nr:FAD binding domain-containing protein [Hypomontagnella monticulosa]
MSHPFKKVIIAGAGPAGLLLGLLLAQEGIQVHILEASHELNTQPRAAYYGPAAIPDLKKAGIINKIRSRGLSPTFMSWRRGGTFEQIASLDGELLGDIEGQDLRKACLVLNELNQIMLEDFLYKYHGTISWEHRVVDTGQDENQAWVDVEVEESEEPIRIYGDYVVGCDGGKSAVRKSLFGDEFPGFTWDRQIVATNVYYDFAKYGFRDLTLVIHPRHFYLVARLTLDGLYRVTYGESPGLTWEEMKARLPLKFELMLPGNPTPKDYKIVNMSPYKIHQRCAPSFRKGRILLAGDAAHLCNPWGGLGITGGFVDVGGLYECLAGIWHGKADDSILDIYSAKRIEMYKTVIDPASQANLRRTTDCNPGTILTRDAFLQACKRGETDERLRKELLLASLYIRYDFTQHYKNKPKE